MEQWQQDNRRDVVMVDIDQLVPKDHLPRKIEKVMEYDWLYERLSPYYCHGVGRDGTDPVVLIKMVLIQHLFGIPSLRQTYREIQLNVAYRWFLGYSLLDRIPHFATVSYAFCKRFPTELPAEIFEHMPQEFSENLFCPVPLVLNEHLLWTDSCNNLIWRHRLSRKASKHSADCHSALSSHI